MLWSLDMLNWNIAKSIEKKSTYLSLQFSFIMELKGIEDFNL